MCQSLWLQNKSAHILRFLSLQSCALSAMLEKQKKWFVWKRRKLNPYHNMRGEYNNRLTPWQIQRFHRDVYWERCQRCQPLLLSCKSLMIIVSRILTDAEIKRVVFSSFFHVVAVVITLYVQLLMIYR